MDDDTNKIQKTTMSVNNMADRPVDLNVKNRLVCKNDSRNETQE